MSYWHTVLTQMGCLAGAADRPRESIALTSCAHGHGVSTVAMNVAAIAAETADVLLLDANLRRPSLAKLLQVPESPGLVDALADSGTAVQMVHRSRTTGLSVLPVGRIDKFSYSHQERFPALLRSLAADHQLVICDFPPVTADAEFLPWLAQIDRVFLVLQHGKTDAIAAQACTAMLRHMGVNLAGVIVNQSRPQKWGAGNVGFQHLN